MSCVSECVCASENVPALNVPVIQAEDAAKENIVLDKAEYFVIFPQAQKKVILVEHYSYDNALLHVVEGKDARSIYLMLIKNGWGTELSHAAYLGKELARAELSLTDGTKYVQDGA